MSEAIAAVTSRIVELEGFLGRLASSPWLAPAGPLSGDPRGAARDPGSVTMAAANSVWSAPFVTLLEDLASISGEAPVPSAREVVPPVPGGRISQPFRIAAGGEGHAGLDIAAPLGTPVWAIASGVVRFAGRVADGAVVVRVEHADGSEALYGHLDPALPVRVGERVAAGEPIGRIGLTGRTTGPHVHLELRSDGRPIDPQPILASGRLPGTSRATTAEASTEAALRRFDAVASDLPYATEIRTAAVAAGVDPLLLAALVRTESGFRPTAVSRAGAMGLTQLMPATARSLGVADPFDPAANLEGGARYLAGNLRIFGRVDLALAAYQAGKAAVRRAGGIPDSPVTRGYVARVLETWARYLTAAEGSP